MILIFICRINIDDPRHSRREIELMFNDDQNQAENWIKEEIWFHF